MKNISILLVEDDEFLIEQLEEYLKMFFDTVLIARNGKEGYKLYQKLKPDIIMTDINMPELNGLDLIKKIREKDNSTEIIILSAHTNTEYFQEAIKLRLISYLVKPMQSNKIKEVILEAKDRINQKSYINLTNGYRWNTQQNLLFEGENKISLTNYEILFIQRLLKTPNQTVGYEDIHYYIYKEDEFSQNAISSLVKRIRKKIPKEIIKSSYKEGYKIEL